MEKPKVITRNWLYIIIGALLNIKDKLKGQNKLQKIAVHLCIRGNTSLETKVDVKRFELKYKVLF